MSQVCVWVKSMDICFLLTVCVIGVLLCSLVDAISTAGTGKLRQE